MPPRLTLLIPAFNEAAHVERVLAEVLAASAPFDAEIVVVDDGSTDGTGALLDAIAARDARVRLLRHPTNRGKTAAIRTGLAQARGDVVLIQDADLEYSPSEYPRLLAPFADPGVAAVYGSRFLARAWPTGMHPANWLANKLFVHVANLLYRGALTDEGTGFKVIRRGILQSIGLESSGFEFCPEVTAKLLRRGLRIVEVPVSYGARGRREGKKPGFADGLAVLWTLVRYRFDRLHHLVDRPWALLVSMRTSAILLAVLSALMLANVAVPQRGVSPEAYAELVARGGAWRFAVETLGLGHVSTSPIFRAVLWLFFASLAAVLVDRTGATVRRARLRPPTGPQLRALAEADPLPVSRDRGWSPGAARVVLERLGYRVASAGEGAIWAVKNPAAIFGFPLFHLSFFILCAAGLQLYFTRDVASAIVTEGQRVQSAGLRVERRAPAGDAPPVDLVLDRVEVELREGRPTGLEAHLRSLLPGEPPREARVNFPAEWGSLSVLVERVGVAPVIQLVDHRGSVLDLVSVPVGAAGGATTVPLGDGTLKVTIEPVPVGPLFPTRALLPRLRLWTHVEDGDRIVFEGALGLREPVQLGSRTLVIDELRYWTLLRFVHERGGPLLIVGFAVLVLGIVWRMVWYRREVVVVWDGAGARLAGRAEFYPARFREELAALREALEEPGRLGVRPGDEEGT